MVHLFVVSGYVTSYVFFCTAFGFASLLKSVKTHKSKSLFPTMGVCNLLGYKGCIIQISYSVVQLFDEQPLGEPGFAGQCMGVCSQL